MKFNKVFHYFDIHHSLFDILRFKTKCAQVNNMGGSEFTGQGYLSFVNLARRTVQISVTPEP